MLVTGCIKQEQENERLEFLEIQNEKLIVENKSLVEKQEELIQQMEDLKENYNIPEEGEYKKDSLGLLAFYQEDKIVYKFVDIQEISQADEFNWIVYNEITNPTQTHYVINHVDISDDVCSECQSIIYATFIKDYFWIPQYGFAQQGDIISENIPFPTEYLNQTVFNIEDLQKIEKQFNSQEFDIHWKRKEQKYYPFELEVFEINSQYIVFDNSHTNSMYEDFNFAMNCRSGHRVTYVYSVTNPEIALQYVQKGSYHNLYNFDDFGEWKGMLEYELTNIVSLEKSVEQYLQQLVNYDPTNIKYCGSIINFLPAELKSKTVITYEDIQNIETMLNQQNQNDISILKLTK